MSERPDDRELLEDLDLLCAGRLDADGFDRLQGRLKDDPRAQRLYLDYVDTHLAIGRLLRPGLGGDAPVTNSTRGFPVRFRLRPRGLALLGSAALLLAAVTAGLLIRGRTDREAGTRPDAKKDEEPRLAQVSGARFFGRPSLSSGSRLRFGEEYALSHGLMEVAFADGATVIIKAPAVFLVAGRSRLVLKLGRCSAHTPPGAEGFRVVTPLTEVVDLGTRFSVDVADTGGTDVQVVEGAADVYLGGAPGATDAHARLETGQASRYQPKPRVAAEGLAFDASKYTSRLPDRVVSYEVSERGKDGAEELRGVTVQRDGRLCTYSTGELIGIDLVHFRATGSDNNITTVTGDLDPQRDDPTTRDRAALLDRDLKLNTGVINAGGSREPLAASPVFHDPERPGEANTPGFAVRFREPLINSAGPDLVFFDLQVIVHPEKGDPFHVSPLQFAPGLKTHTVRSFDIDLASPEARTLAGFRLYSFDSPPRSLGELRRGRHNGGSDYRVRAKALAVGIDLSDLGYPPGASVDGLFFQDALDDGNLVDPVFIAGLPPLDRPETRETTR